MNQTVHIIRKDLRRLRWPLLAWIVILIARVMLWSLAPNAAAEFRRAILVSQASSALASLEILLLAFLAARLIHGEAPVGLNAFWLTRPYSPRALVAAKLLFATVALLILPLAADLMTMAIFHAGGYAQSSAAPTFVAGYAMWLFPLLALAAMTPTLAAYAMAIVGILLGVSILALGMLAAMLFVGPEQSRVVAAQLYDPAPDVFGTAVAVVVAIGLVAFQYRYRRWRVAMAVAVAGSLLAPAASELWSMLSGRPQVDPGAWSRDAAVAPVVLEDRWQTRAEHEDPSEDSPVHRVYGRIHLRGMPPDYSIQSVGADATLRLADGTTLRSLQTRSFGSPVTATSNDVESLSDGTALRAALGDAELVMRTDSSQAYEQWSAVIELNSQEYDRHRGKPGRLEATLQFHLTRTRKRGTLPLNKGAAVMLDEGLSRVEIMRAGQDVGRFGVDVLEWKVFPFLEPIPPTNSIFVLQNRSRREAFLTRNRSPRSLPGSGGSTLLGVLNAARLNPNSAGFSVNAEQIRIFNRIVLPGGLLTFEPEWFDGAEMVVLESAYAGTVTRSLVIDDFVIPDE